MIYEYEKNGKKLYKSTIYVGTHPITGKKVRKKKSGFTSKRDAKIWEAQVMNDTSLLDASVSLVDENITFRELTEQYNNTYERTVRPSTYVGHKIALKTHVLPVFGNKRVKDITVLQCQLFADNLASKLQTFSPVLNIVKRILDFGKRMQLITDNPMEKIIKPKKPRAFDGDKAIMFYEKEQLKVFLDYLKNKGNKQKYTVFHTLAFTGLRIGELLALTWQDVDFKNKTLNIDKTVTSDKDGKATIGTPKTRTSKRVLDLDDVTLQVLKDWKTEQAKTLEFSVLKSGRLFSTKTGNIPEEATVRYWAKATAKACDLPYITVHGFRHTHASLLFEAGASIKAVQDRLGHSKMDMTMNIYTHVTKKQKSDLADRFSSYMQL